MEGPSSRASTGSVGWVLSCCQLFVLLHRRYYAEPVVNGIPYSVKGYRGSARLYSVQVFIACYYVTLPFNVIWFQVAEAGEGYLNIMANGGVGDVDIYVRFDEYPTWVS